jgi:hypothetical protein
MSEDGKCETSPPAGWDPKAPADVTLEGDVEVNTDALEALVEALLEKLCSVEDGDTVLEVNVDDLAELLQEILDKLCTDGGLDVDVDFSEVLDALNNLDIGPVSIDGKIATTPYRFVEGCAKGEGDDYTCVTGFQLATCDDDGNVIGWPEPQWLDAPEGTEVTLGCCPCPAVPACPEGMLRQCFEGPATIAVGALGGLAGQPAIWSNFRIKVRKVGDPENLPSTTDAFGNECDLWCNEVVPFETTCARHYVAPIELITLNAGDHIVVEASIQPLNCEEAP